MLARSQEHANLKKKDGGLDDRIKNYRDVFHLFSFF